MIEEDGRIKSYVAGFDEKLDGGIPNGHIVLICGEPGTMKSSLAFSILYNNALKEDKVGAFLSLEQGRKSLLKQMKGMGMDPQNIEDKLSIVDLSLIRKNLEALKNQTWVEIFKMYASNLKKNTDFVLFAVDSLSILETLARFEYPREELFQLFEWLRDLGVTSLIISEMIIGEKAFGRYGEDFIADGIIHVKMENVDDVTVQRRIRCVKMRGTSHSPNYYTLLFEGGVFQATRVISD
ncbi:MAG: ATPase domain-containing protein [Thermoplasmata archaeon]